MGASALKFILQHPPPGLLGSASDMRRCPDSNRTAAMLRCLWCQREGSMFERTGVLVPVQVRRHLRDAVPRINIGTTSKLAFVATHHVLTLLSAPPTVSMFSKSLPRSNPETSPSLLLPGLRLVQFLHKKCACPKEGKQCIYPVHVIKRCKKCNPHRFAALQNCSWVSVANDSLP